MDILTYINRMNQLYGNDTQVASSQLNIPAHMEHQFEGGQLTPEEFYQNQSIPITERPLTGAEGGRVYDTRKYLQGGRVGFENAGAVNANVLRRKEAIKNLNDKWTTAKVTEAAEILYPDQDINEILSDPSK